MTSDRLSVVIAAGFAALSGPGANAKCEIDTTAAEITDEEAAFPAGVAEETRYPESFVQAEGHERRSRDRHHSVQGEVPGGLDRYLAAVPSCVRIELVAAINDDSVA